MTKTKADKRLLEIRKELPPEISVDGFQPTAKQIEYGWAYRLLLEKCGYGETVDKVTMAHLSQIGLGNDKSLYYKWKKSPRFNKWLNLVANDFFKGDGLRQVQMANHQRACLNSPQDTKIYMELHNPDYKPTAVTEHKVSGLRPPDAISEQKAIEASRKRIESITKGETDEAV